MPKFVVQHGYRIRKVNGEFIEAGQPVEDKDMIKKYPHLLIEVKEQKVDQQSKSQNVVEPKKVK